MYKNVNNKIKKILQLLEEIETYELYKDLLVRNTNKLFSQYQDGKFDYSTYKEKLRHVLKDKTKKDWINYYDSYIYSLLKQMEFYNAEIFSDLSGQVRKAKPKLVAKKAPTHIEKDLPRKELKKAVSEPIEPQKEELVVAPEENKVQFKSMLGWFFSLFKPKHKKIKTKKKKPSPFGDLLRQETTIEEPKKEEPVKSEETVAYASPFAFLKRLFKKESPSIIAEKASEVNLTTLNFSKARERIKFKSGVDIDATLLAKEAKRVKDLMSKKPKIQIYNLSFFSYLSNLVVRNLTYSLLKQFPSFFKGIYNDLRLANIKLLSNTYVNLMVFSTLVAGFIVFILSLISLSLTPQPFFLAFAKSLIFAIILGAVVFVLYYLYPKLQISSRKKSIHTNLPFAINHMAAVAGSGVSPAKMFELISESTEYGEFSVEIAKIVQYTEIFGYDLLTAIKTTLSITPSPRLKEFFEGFVSAVESGSDIKDYLKQRAKEAMVSYEMERKKYQETISTYSDIYTGIMVAAPLFFVAALSLVSLLGGSLGGMDVNVVIVLGTYVIIPLMNLVFLVFLNITQVET